MCTYSASKTHLSVAQTLSTTLFQNHSQLQISLDFLTHVQPVVLCVWSQDLGSSADTEGDSRENSLVDKIVAALWEVNRLSPGYEFIPAEVPAHWYLCHHWKWSSWKKKSSVCTLVVKTQLCTPALLIEQVISMESAVSKDFKAE